MTAGGRRVPSVREDLQRRLNQIISSQAGLEVALDHPEDPDHGDRLREHVRDIAISLVGDDVALDELDAYRENRQRHTIKLGKAYAAAREAGRSILDVDLDTAELRPVEDGAERGEDVRAASPVEVAADTVQWEHWAAGGSDTDASGAEL